MKQFFITVIFIFCICIANEHAWSCVSISGTADTNGVGCLKIGTACYTCGTYTAQCASGCSTTTNLTGYYYFSGATSNFNYCNGVASTWTNIGGTSVTNCLLLNNSVSVNGNSGTACTSTPQPIRCDNDCYSTNGGASCAACPDGGSRTAGNPWPAITNCFKTGFGSGSDSTGYFSYGGDGFVSPDTCYYRE